MVGQSSLLRTRQSGDELRDLLKLMSDTETTATHTPVAPQVLGRLQEFDPKVDNIYTYLERLELYFEVNTVEADRQVSVLATHCHWSKSVRYVEKFVCSHSSSHQVVIKDVRYQKQRGHKLSLTVVKALDPLS